MRQYINLVERMERAGLVGGVVSEFTELISDIKRYANHPVDALTDDIYNDWLATLDLIESFNELELGGQYKHSDKKDMPNAGFQVKKEARDLRKQISKLVGKSTDVILRWLEYLPIIGQYFSKLRRAEKLIEGYVMKNELTPEQQVKCDELREKCRMHRERARTNADLAINEYYAKNPQMKQHYQENPHLPKLREQT